MWIYPQSPSLVVTFQCYITDRDVTSSLLALNIWAYTGCKMLTWYWIVFYSMLFSNDFLICWHSLRYKSVLYWPTHWGFALTQETDDLRSRHSGVSDVFGIRNLQRFSLVAGKMSLLDIRWYCSCIKNKKSGIWALLLEATQQFYSCWRTQIVKMC